MQYPHSITHVVGIFNLNGVPSAFNVELYADNEKKVLGHLYCPYLSEGVKEIFQQRVKHIAISHAQANLSNARPTQVLETSHPVEHGAKRNCDMVPIVLYCSRASKTQQMWCTQCP